MNFNFTEDQNAIKALAQQIFSDRTTDEFLLQFADEEKSYDEPLWQTLAEQGLLALNIPEAQGGTELGLIELCLMLEEQGHSLSPIPLYSTLVLGVLPIVEFANDDIKNKYLPAVAEGKLKLTAAISETGSCEAHTSIASIDDSLVVNGELSMVPDGAVANAVLVPVQNAQGETQVVIIDTDAQGVSVQAIKSHRGEIQANITLNNVQADAAQILGGADVLQWIELHAELALCALQVGVCEEAIKRTAEYTTERKQFGAPIGSIGMVAMQAADAYIDSQAMRSTYLLALYRLSAGLDARTEIYSAKYQAAEGGHRIVHRTQHLHGGIGADITYPIHRYFLWAKHISVMLGGGHVALEKLGKILANDETTGRNFLNIA